MSGRMRVAGPGAPARNRRALGAGNRALRWYIALLGGLLPLLVGGFLASAVADRIAFVGWALAAALAYSAMLRRAWGSAWPPAARVAAPLAVLAVAAVAFVGLALRYGEDLRLGWAAVSPLGSGG